LKKINLVYKSKVVRKKSAFKNEINISISQDLQNNNEISMINQTNNNENLESNINNTFYELFTVESMAKSGIYNSTFIQDDEICK
jgi:poly-beta-hydroxyalkanoate depolymerase